MKKIILMLCCIMALILSSCGGSSNNGSTTSNNAEQSAVSGDNTEEENNTDTANNSENTDVNQESTVNNTKEESDVETGKWIIQQETDEFGDEIKDGASLIINQFEGTFSNTATNDSELDVIITCDLNNKTLYFDLKEYKDTNATYLSTDMIKLKYKGEDGKIHEHLLAGNAPNSSMRLDDNDEIGLNITFKRQDWESGFSDFCQKLWYGQDVKCIVEIGSSKYNFIVNGASFSEAAKELGFTFEEPTKEEATLLALQCFTSGVGYELEIGNPMTIGIVNFAKHLNEYEVVTADAEKILPGQWAIYRMYNDGTGYCCKYLEDGTRISYGDIHGLKFTQREEREESTKWELKDGKVYNYLKTPYDLLDLGYEGCYLLYDTSENGGLDDSLVMIRLDEDNKPLANLE